MKKIIAALILVSSFSVFAGPTNICFKNDGHYFAKVTFKLMNKDNQQIFQDEYDIIGREDMVCLMGGLHPEDGEYVNVEVKQYVFIGIDRSICHYDNITNQRIIVSNGTISEHWCHDSTEW